MKSITAFFTNRDKSFFILAGILFSILIGIIDYVTRDFFVFEFYLFPVVTAVWFAGRNVGIFAAFVSAMAETVLDIIESSAHSSPWAHYSNFFLNLGFFIAIVYLLEFLKKTLVKLENTSEAERIINKQLRSEIEQRKLLEKELKNTQEELRTLSITDPLTGLYNRRGFLSLAPQQIKVAKRNKQGIGLLFADLDNLKWINDTLGHKEGDSALVEIANIFRVSFRESDVVARIGGDEFVALTIQPHKDYNNVITARLQNNLDRLNAKAVHNYKLSLSIGVVYYDTDQPRTIDELLSAADKLMFEQKQAKKSS
ncbi:MAG: GGDEF domain-containing protein [Deltaproteobacteria bacterium]